MCCQSSLALRAQASVVIAAAFSRCVSCFASAFSSCRPCASSSGGSAHLWAEHGRVFFVFRRVSAAVLNRGRELSKSSNLFECRSLPHVHRPRCANDGPSTVLPSIYIHPQKAPHTRSTPIPSIYTITSSQHALNTFLATFR